MKKRSNHHLDTFRWIEKVINSCETYQQTITARQLINNYEKLMIFKGIEYRTVADLESILKHKLLILQSELINF
jgi:hypothetical protein